KAYWSDHSEEHRKTLHILVALETTKFQYTDGVADVSRVDPDNWVHDQALLDRPGNAEIQMDLFYDYRTNVQLYPQVQAYFRKHQPPTVIVWGKNDKIFPADGAYPYKRDLPKVEFPSTRGILRSRTKPTKWYHSSAISLTVRSRHEATSLEKEHEEIAGVPKADEIATLLREFMKTEKQAGRRRANGD